MKIVDYKEAHADELITLDSTGRLLYMREEGYFHVAMGSKIAWSAINRFGNCVAIGGILEHWKGRDEIWGAVQTSTPGEFVSVHRAAKRMVGQHRGRLELVVDYEFQEGHRWAHLLGFVLESQRMRSYSPNGGDASLYARVVL